jgi:hypothetical protein
MRHTRRTKQRSHSLAFRQGVSPLPLDATFPLIFFFYSLFVHKQNNSIQPNEDLLLFLFSFSIFSISMAQEGVDGIFFAWQKGVVLFSIPQKSGLFSALLRRGGLVILRCFLHP